MAVAGVQHGDATGEVDQAAALDVPHLGVFGAVDEDLVRLAQPDGQGGAASRHQGRIGGVGDLGFAVHSGLLLWMAGL